MNEEILKNNVDLIKKDKTQLNSSSSKTNQKRNSASPESDVKISQNS
jgi:hypothetical protein